MIPVTKIKPSTELWKVVCEQIYRQNRRNQAGGKRPIVDVLATEPYADMFHQMFEHDSKARYAMPVIVKWEENYLKVLGMRCRMYRAYMLTFPNCEIAVCIPDPHPSYEHIFAVPDYESGTYFDFLTNETRPFPELENQPDYETIKAQNLET